jgi:adiponectin receptor
MSTTYLTPLTTTERDSKPPPSRTLFTFQEVHPWQRDNEYLTTHYRCTTNSYRECLKSLSYLHNQTGNIYTHLVGAVCILLYAVYAYSSVSARYDTADINDLLAFGVFVGSAVVCFGVSATFHVFGNHSSSVYHTWLQLDLYGIFVLIVGTVYSGTYYGFYCQKQYWVLYSAGVSSISCGRGDVVLLMQVCWVDYLDCYGCGNALLDS